MPGLIRRTFAEWTEGLSPRESMILIFERIRDIPYQITRGVQDPVLAEELLLTEGRGSCSPKHHLLAEMYRMLNLSVVFATFPFSWNQPGVRYPPDLRDLSARLPVAYHLACRVQIGCRWVLVDATWDRSLKKAGFPVNEHWDGISDTKCAVRPIREPVRTAYCRTGTNEPCRGEEEQCFSPLDGEHDHWDAESHTRFFRERVRLRTREDLLLQEQFYDQFNAWLEDVRKSP